MSDEQIFNMCSGKGTYYDKCAVMFNYTEPVHHMKLMTDMRQDIEDTYDVGYYDVVLPIAYFFMFYNMFKTKIHISKEHIQKIITVFENEGRTENMYLITANDKKFCREFNLWLTDMICKFQANVYTAIYYIMYTRFWEFDDIQQYSFSERQNILSKMYKYDEER